MDDSSKQKTINILYIILVISTVLSFVPLMVAQILSIPLIIIVLIAAYICRSRDNQDGLLYNHMTYLIGTIWIGSTFLALGVVAAGLYMFAQGDHSLITQTAENMMNGQGVQSEQELMDLSVDYMMANKEILITGTLLFVGPAIIYFIYRIAHGYSRAIKGYRIAKPKSWL